MSHSYSAGLVQYDHALNVPGKPPAGRSSLQYDLARIVPGQPPVGWSSLAGLLDLAIGRGWHPACRCSPYFHLHYS